MGTFPAVIAAATKHLAAFVLVRKFAVARSVRLAENNVHIS